MIKKIHYCWFGSATPDAVKRNVDHWAMLNPDFEIIRWNESNIDVSGYEFGERALQQKKWGFLVDTIRPKALYDQGGFYLDADIELVSPLNRLEQHGGKLIMGYMYQCALGTAALYSPPGHPYLKDILEIYRSCIKQNRWIVSNSIFTEYFINHVSGFLLNGKRWENDLACIFPKEFLEQPAFVKSRGVAIHHYSGSWSPEKNGEFSLATTGHSGISHILLWLRRQIRLELGLRRNEFYPTYKNALKGIKSPYHSDYYNGNIADISFHEKPFK